MGGGEWTDRPYRLSSPEAMWLPETPWDPARNLSWEQETRVGSCSVTAEAGAFPGGGKQSCPWPLPPEGLRLPSALLGLAQNWGSGAEWARTRDWESEDLGPPEGSVLGCHSSGGSALLRACVLTCEAYVRSTPRAPGTERRAPGAA